MHHSPHVQRCGHAACCISEEDFPCQVSPCFQAWSSSNENISPSKQLNGCWSLHCVRLGRQMGIKQLQELLDNDFISFSVQCPATLQIVRGSGCVCAIDLGHLIRQPSDRLLTSNGGSINPFQNILLLFAPLCSISPRPGTQEKDTAEPLLCASSRLLIHFSFFFFPLNAKRKWFMKHNQNFCLTFRHTSSVKQNEQNCFCSVEENQIC